MGVSCKVQPKKLYCLGFNKRLGYTVLMGVPPKVQSTNIVLALTKDWVILYSWVCHLKYSLVILTWLLLKTGLYCTHG